MQSDLKIFLELIFWKVNLLLDPIFRDFNTRFDAFWIEYGSWKEGIGVKKEKTGQFSCF